MAPPLGRACGAEAHRVLTSRNRVAWLRGRRLAANPDLIASGEGGSNLTLVRPSGALGPIARTARAGDPRRPPRAPGDGADPHRLGALHRQPARTNELAELASADVTAAAAAACDWAGERPLLFGGDLNLRPDRNPELFEDLRERLRPGAPQPPRPRSTTSWFGA